MAGGAASPRRGATLQHGHAGRRRRRHAGFPPARTRGHPRLHRGTGFPDRRTPAGAEQLREPGLSGGHRGRPAAGRQVLPPGPLERRGHPRGTRFRRGTGGRRDSGGGADVHRPADPAPRRRFPAGRITARLHNCGAREPFAHRPTLDIESFGDESREFLLDEGFIPDDLATSYDTLSADLLARAEHCFEAAGDVRHLRLHGDLHPSNLLVRDEQVHIVDLDDARMGPAVQDLWMFLSGDRDEQTPQLAELLAGYTEFRPFEARELRLIEALRTLRIMHYAA